MKQCGEAFCLESIRLLPLLRILDVMVEIMILVFDFVCPSSLPFSLPVRIQSDATMRIFPFQLPTLHERSVRKDTGKHAIPLLP